MSCSITNHAGKQVFGARSSGSGVFAAFDWRDMVLNPADPIIRKAQSERGSISHFPPEDRDKLKAHLGHYSKLQSAHSEDSVTWSVFGAQPLQFWLPAVLACAFEEPSLPGLWSARFWERQKHPDTGMLEHGPESEITLIAKHWCIEVEAKWRSDIDGAQGRDRQTSQVQMRAHTARENAGIGGKFGVLIVAPRPDRYPPARSSGSVFRRYFDVDGDSYKARSLAKELSASVVTWESLASALDLHNDYSHVAAYLRWRLGLLR